MEAIKIFNNTKMLNEDSLIFLKKSLKPIDYSKVMDLCSQLAKNLEIRITKSIIGNHIKVFKHGMPTCYVVSKKDTRIVPSYVATERFNFRDLITKASLTEHLVIQQMSSIIEELIDDIPFLYGGLYYTDESKTECVVQFFFREYCMKDMLNVTNVVRTVDKNAINDEIEAELNAVIALIKKHPVGSLMFPSNLENRHFLFNNNKTLLRQISSGSYSKEIFLKSFGLNLFSAGLNVAYHCDEVYLHHTNLAVYQLFNNNGTACLYLGNNNTSKLIS